MKRIITLLLLCAPIAIAHAQQALDINAILSAIETNNTQLKALRQANAATIAEQKAENTIGATSIEYSPFFQKGTSGVASSELIVSQEFDFPTAYANRRKSADLQENILNQEYLIARRDILLQARKLCCDLQHSISRASFIDSRTSNTDSLLTICQKRITQGDATIMELNRIKMDKMTLLTEKVQNDGEMQKIKVQLEGMGAPKLTDTNIAPLQSESAIPTEAGLEVSLANATFKSAQHDLKASKQDWLPRLTIGYRRNTELREASNGPLVGVALPLFSNSRKVKAARMRQQAAEQELESARHKVETQRLSLQTEANNLQQQLKTYDLPLMQQTLATLMRAVEAGQISITDYYTEADRIYTILQNKLSIENNYNKVMAELNSL